MAKAKTVAKSKPKPRAPSKAKPRATHVRGTNGHGRVAKPKAVAATPRASKESKRVYMFKEGRGEMRDLLGGKGSGLAEMARIGLPVPPGFVITTKTCIDYQKEDRLPADLMADVRAAFEQLEKQAGRRFGDEAKPLLVSVRSGAPISMPGMMDTVLNLGLNDQTAAALAKEARNERFAWDAYRRFVTMFGNVVLGIPHEEFEHVLEAMKRKRNVKLDTALTATDLKEVTQRLKHMVEERTKRDFPTDPWRQLEMGIEAVFKSWNNKRAIAYRDLNRIPHEMGTAVVVQMMVFGNMGEDSATGVAFTRDPSTGEKRFYGEFLTNAQGEDVVAGTRTPLPIRELDRIMPNAYKQLTEIAEKLERHFRDLQDIEFTIMQGKLHMLQTRAGKRTGFASVRIAVEMAEEGLISRDDAVKRVEPDQLNQLLRPVFDFKEKEAAVKGGKVVAKGLNAGPGAATGRVVFNAEDAESWAKNKEKVILVRHETSPEDIRGMHASEGFLTARGGMTSHAALVARQMGKVCVAGCSALELDYRNKRATITTKAGQRLTLNEGDWLSLDGFTGEVILGKVNTRPSEVVQVLVEGTMKPEQSVTYQLFHKLLGWADGLRRLKVRANADQPDQARASLAFGAEGIGLCRTEHMFFGPGKIGPMREMILAQTTAERKRALAKLLPLQREDFHGIFAEMQGHPVTIRMLDPPLHEFLPHEPRQQEELAREMGITVDKLRDRVEQLRESNPMLGHRGCRLGVSYPEITAMQARAIFEAALDVKKAGQPVTPEIMIPIVSLESEFVDQERVVRDVANKVFAERGDDVPYLVGTMIELPRACLTADEIAKHAEFFSFGTNDLTQTTFGLSRDDAGVFLAHYYDKKLLADDPFATLDQKGVGKMVEMATTLGRGANPKLKVGICGEHGGDPASVEFCHRIGLDYVSCSPFRLPLARLAGAHAVLRERGAEVKRGES